MGGKRSIAVNLSTKGGREAMCHLCWALCWVSCACVCVCTACVLLCVCVYIVYCVCVCVCMTRAQHSNYDLHHASLCHCITTWCAMHATAAYCVHHNRMGQCTTGHTLYRLRPHTKHPRVAMSAWSCDELYAVGAPLPSPNPNPNPNPTGRGGSGCEVRRGGRELQTRGRRKARGRL